MAQAMRTGCSSFWDNNQGSGPGGGLGGTGADGVIALHGLTLADFGPTDIV